jgi:hypothetical protein
MNPEKRDKEERDSKRASARTHQRAQGAPYLVFGVDSRARLQQGKHGDRVSVPGGSDKRSGPVLLQKSGQSESWAGCTCAHAYTWMRVWMCACKPIRAFTCAHPSICTHCVHMCVCICTHACAYTHTQTCIQDTNPKLWDSKN